MKKKIYFAGSIRSGRDDQALYSRLISYLSKHGQVLTEHVGDGRVTGEGEEGLSDEEIFERDLSWIRQADVVVAEVSTPSTGVGYEVATAEALNKPILCLYKEQENRKLSAMIDGNSRLRVARYAKFEEAVKHIDEFFKSVE